MDFENLTPEQKEKAKACKTSEEMLALAKEEGYELNDDELEAVAGGASWTTEEINGVSTTYKECKKLECNDFGCTQVICPEFSCNGYENR